MSKQTDRCAAYTGAIRRRGIFAEAPHYTPNGITRTRRLCVFTRIDENALETIDAIAAKWRETRGEAIGRIVRTVRGRSFTVQGEGGAACA